MGSNKRIDGVKSHAEITGTDMAVKIYDAAMNSGFDYCGIIPVNDLDGFDELLRERKKKIRTSGIFYSLCKGLNKTKKRFPWAKSIVICIHDYSRYKYPEKLMGKYAKDFFLVPEDHPIISYDHLKFEEELKQLGIRFAGGEQYEYFSVAPLRYAAMKAGLGIIRKNNFFYTEHGSHNRLMGYVIDQGCELRQDIKLKPCSEKCNLCQKACKTKALSAPYTFSPFHCVSFWTTFGKGFVPPYLKADMFEEWICGCDNCQDACPYNRTTDWNSGERFSNLEEIADKLQPEQLVMQSDKFLIEHVISKTDKHLKPSDVSVLRRNARRVIRFNENKT